MLRPRSTAIVRRYAHLSPSYWQETVKKVSGFGKAKELEPTKAEIGEKSTERTTVPKEEVETFTGNATVPKTGKWGKEMDGQ
ncbi:MAG: hypothetical protein KF693_11270 [Nitrospira sp.]|nr:hypothetical protein [Nitrospira sp.]